MFMLHFVCGLSFLSLCVVSMHVFTYLFSLLWLVFMLLAPLSHVWPPVVISPMCYILSWSTHQCQFIIFSTCSWLGVGLSFRKSPLFLVNPWVLPFKASSSHSSSFWDLNFLILRSLPFDCLLKESPPVIEIKLTLTLFSSSLRYFTNRRIGLAPTVIVKVFSKDVPQWVVK